MFNPYSSSSRHHTDHVDPSLDEEDCSDDSYSSNGSGSETAAPGPRSGRATGSRATRSTTPSIPVPALPPLDFFRGSSNPSGLSKSKSQQPWVAEPSGYKEKESARSPAQPTSGRQDPRGREADTDFVVGSYRGESGGGLSGLSISKAISQQPWVGQPAASSDSQSRSGHKEKEGARASAQPSSNRPDPLGRGKDTDFVVGSYRGEAGGGISGHAIDYQSRSGNREKESARSRREESRVRGTDEDYVTGGRGLVESYRGEAGGGISGHAIDYQSRSGNREKESARSRREESRVRVTDEDYVTGGRGLVEGYRGEAGGGTSGHPSDSQPRSSHKEKESTRVPMQPSSSRPDPRGRGADTDFVVGSYRGEPGGGISAYPSDSQSRSGNKEKESARSILGHPSDSQPRSSYKEESSRSSGQQSSSRQERAKGTDANYTGKQTEFTSGGLNRSPYPPGTTSTTAHSSRSPNPTTSIPQGKEDIPPYDTTRESGRGRERSQPADPSHTAPYSAFPPTRPPQHDAQYSLPSQVQSSLSSQRPENTWHGGPSLPSGGRDSSSNPFVGAAVPRSRGGQPTGPLPGWSAHPPHRVFFPPSLLQNF